MNIPNNPAPITLTTLPQATKQQIFDYVARHLLTQNEQSVDSELNCRYRGDNNLKCAAGCLIADHEYNPSMESVTWSGLISQGKAPEKHSILIETLQIMHDTVPVVYWKKYLKKLTEDLNLSPVVLDEFPDWCAE